MKKFKRSRALGFFDVEIRLSKLSKLGDPLERLSLGLDFELFRSYLTGQLAKIAKGAGGRPPYDYVLMFKILILQRYYNLSDDQMEYQINDRLSFMRFLGLTLADEVPDSKTVWLFREQLIELEAIEGLFLLFLEELSKLNLVVHEGKIIDASFIEVPKQRNSREENAEIKKGLIPASISANPHVESQKDTDARWTKKGGASYFGYKNHIKVDSKSKIITGYTVTVASDHDSQELDNLIDSSDTGQELYADAAYKGEKQSEQIESKGMTDKVHERAYVNTPLTEEQIANNKIKSKTRARVEHVFGFMEMSMNGMYLYNIGKKRITAVIGLMNLTYNMFRKIQLMPI